MTATQLNQTDTNDSSKSQPSGTLNHEEANSAAHLRSRIQKGKGGSLQTNRGTYYVTKPYRSRTDQKFRAIVAFAPRASYFDLSNADSSRGEFRGFFTLFWISLFILSIRTYIVSFEQTGQPLSLGFASMFSRHALALALSDAALVGSTVLFCVPFAMALKSGLLEYNAFALGIQHTFQTLLLAATITWTFNRQWPWVQSGFLTLHTLVMIMKIHSYMAYNGNLSSIAREAKKVELELRKATDNVGGWDQAIQDANNNRQTESETTTVENSVAGTPTLLSEGTTNIIYNSSTAATLRNRLLAATESIPKDPEISGPTSENDDRPSHPLAQHPDPEISRLGHELSELEADITSSGPAKVRWPENVSWGNYFDYLLVPSLVYCLEFPRTERIRPLYVLEKTIATFGTFTLLYTVTAHSILPMVPTREQSFFRSLLDLSLPFMLSYLLLFFIIFECVCNGFAELSRFSDRGFYEDWWNSTSWDEFARKWNKPVHVFLLRHVYTSTMSTHQVSRGTATFLTFLLSAAVHELVMVIVTKKFRMYLFAMQMAQIPLIALGRLPMIKKNKILGNIVFWIGLYAGFPVLCVAYCAY